MATKKDKLTTDKYDIDSELDFGDFDIEQIDAQINPEVRRGSKKRTAVTEVFKGAVGGAKDELKNPAFLARAVKQSMPSSYGEIFKAASVVSESTAQLYDEAVRELKPQMSRIAKKIDRLVPDEQKTLKKLTSKANAFFGSGQQYQGPTSQQLQDQGVATAIAQVFGAQQAADQETRARDNAEARVKEQVDGKRFESNFGLLSSISDSAQRISNYTERVTQAYQKKSLELQYRSYFVQNELLQMSNKYYEIFKSQNEAIAKNTGLPDYVKITNVERLKQAAKDKLAQRANSAIGRGMQRIGDQAREYVGGIKQGMEAALMGLDMAGDLSDSTADLGMTKTQLMGNAAGSFGTRWLMNKASGAVQKLTDTHPKFKKLRDAGHIGSNIVMNPQGAIAKGQNSKWLKDLKAGGGLGGIIGSILDWTGDQFKDQAGSRTIKGQNNLSAMGLGGKFDNRTQRSIVDVIPGYLSQILRQVTMHRTGEQNTPAMMYDYTKGKFDTSKGIYKSMTDAFDRKAKTSIQGFRVDQLANEITGGSRMDAKTDATVGKFFEDLNKSGGSKDPKKIMASREFKKLAKSDKSAYDAIKSKLTGGKESPEDQKKIKQFFLKIARVPNMDYTPENIIASSEFQELLKTDRDIALKVSSYLHDNIANSDEKHANQANLTAKISAVRDTAPDISADIQEFVDAGYAQVLIDKKIIKMKEDGDYEINEVNYQKLIDGTIVTSDERKKTGIQKTDKTSILQKLGGASKFMSPKRALATNKKIGIFDWFYRKGQGDNKQRTGPMAADVKRHMGNDAAPDGEQLDLTTMNGNNMAAIQALSEKQDSMMGSDKNSLSVLQGIKEDTAMIVQLLSNGGGAEGGGVGSPKTYSGILGSIFGPLGSLAGKAGGDLFSAGKKTAGAVGKGIMFGAEKLGNGFDKIKDPATRSLGWIMQKAGEVSMKALEIGQDVMFNKLPAGIKQAGIFKDWAVNKAKELFSRARDVYIKGQNSPAIKAVLLKAGYYRDQATGQVIRTMGDLKNLKGNVVNAAGEVIMTIEDAAKGLVDVDGKAIMTGLEKMGAAALGYAMKGLGRAKNLLGNLGGLGKSLLDKAAGFIPSSFKGMFEGIGIGSKKIYDVLVEIRDILGGKGKKSWSDSGEYSDSSSGEQGDLVGPMPQSASDKLKGAITDKLKGAGRKASVLAKRKARLAGRVGAAGAVKGAGMFSGLKGKLGSIGSSIIGGIAGASAKTFGNERNAKGPSVKGDSQERVGNWKDRLAEQAERAKAGAKGFLKGDTSARYRGANIIDSMMDKAGDVFNFAKKGLSAIFSGAGGLMEAAGSAIGLGGKGGLLGTLGKIGSTLGRGALGLGKAVLNPMGAIKNIGTAAQALRGGAMAARVVSAASMVRNVAMAGSLLTGGVGSAIMGGIGVGLSAIGSILASPVVLSGLAIAAVGYGAYKLYKYSTRDNVNEFEAIRMAQYGLTAADKDYNHFLLGLEEYLCDGKVGYENGKAVILDKAVENKELLSMFSIDENDVDACQLFARWYKSRFQPFFLTHMTALFATNNKAKLSDVHKLKYDEKIKYLGLIGFDGGPYNVVESPFKTLPVLANTKEEALALVKKATDKVVADKTKTQKQAEKYVGTKAAAAVGVSKAAGSVAPSAAPALPKTNVAPMPKAPTAAAAVGAPSFGEEGKEVIMPGSSMKAVIPGGLGKLKVAGGPLRDGSGADQYMKLAPGVKLDLANPSLLKNLRAMIQEYGELTGKTVTINSGARSRAEQEALYRKDPKKAAKPGNSLHEFGLAFDLNTVDINGMEDAGLMRKYGFTRPVGGETWHIEPAGIQGNLNLAKNDASFATQAIEASLFKGGGGVGIIPGSELGRRNASVALAMLDMNDSTIRVSDKDRTADLLQPSNKIKQAISDVAQGATGPSKAANDTSITKPYLVGRTLEQGARFDKKSALPNVTVKSSLPDTEAQPSAMPGNGTDTYSGSKGGIMKAISDAAKKQGVDPNEAMVFAAVESSLNPNAKASSSSATGLFQFTNATWNEQMGKHARKHGLDPNTPPTDVNASALMGTEYFKSNKRALSSVKSDPNLTDVYLAHFLGAGGAKKFLSADPSAIAAQVMPEAAKSNPSIFYAGGRALTISEVYNKIDAKLKTTAQQYGINLPANNGFENKKTAANSPTMAPSSASTAQRGSTAPSTPMSTTAAPARSSNVFGGQQASVMSARDDRAMQQASQSATADFGQVNDTLAKSLDVQTQMLSVLKAIAENVDPENFKALTEAMGKMVPNNATAVKGKGVQSVSSAIDLGRKAA